MVFRLIGPRHHFANVRPCQMMVLHFLGAFQPQGSSCSHGWGPGVGGGAKCAQSSRARTAPDFDVTKGGFGVQNRE